MVNIKKIVIAAVAALSLGVFSVTALAVSAYGSPAEAVAGLTKRTVESVVEERSKTDKTYGEIAKEAGVLEKFKAEILEIKKDYLNKQVAAGKITQKQADEILAAIEKNQANCDGSGKRAGKAFGAGFGAKGGRGLCGGSGLGQGNGNRNRAQNG